MSERKVKALGIRQESGVPVLYVSEEQITTVFELNNDKVLQLLRLCSDYLWVHVDLIERLNAP